MKNDTRIYRGYLTILWQTEHVLYCMTNAFPKTKDLNISLTLHDYHLLCSSSSSSRRRYRPREKKNGLPAISPTNHSNPLYCRRKRLPAASSSFLHFGTSRRISLNPPPILSSALFLLTPPVQRAASRKQSRRSFLV